MSTLVPCGRASDVCETASAHVAARVSPKHRVFCASTAPPFPSVPRTTAPLSRSGSSSRTARSWRRGTTKVPRPSSTRRCAGRWPQSQPWRVLERTSTLPRATVAQRSWWRRQGGTSRPVREEAREEAVHATLACMCMLCGSVWPCQPMWLRVAMSADVAPCGHVIRCGSVCLRVCACAPHAATLGAHADRATSSPRPRAVQLVLPLVITTTPHAMNLHE